jgi:hypothetical protein
VAAHVGHVNRILVAWDGFVKRLRCTRYVVGPVVHHRGTEVEPSGGSVTHTLSFEPGISTGLSKEQGVVFRDTLALHCVLLVGCCINWGERKIL